MAGKRTLLVAGSAAAGVAGTLLLGPADALFAAAEPSLDSGPADAVGTTASAGPSASASASGSAKNASSAKPSSSSKTGSPAASPAAKPRSTTTAASASNSAKNFAGSAAIAGGRYGNMHLTVTVQNGKLTAIDYSKTTVNDGRSQQININALPTLVDEALASQSAQVSGISGASYTTQAFRTALQNALTKAGI